MPSTSPSLRQRLAALLRRWATRLDPPEPGRFNAATALVLEAEQFAPGTSGEFKRHWVYGQLLKRYPSVPKHELGLLIEQAVTQMKA